MPRHLIGGTILPASKVDRFRRFPLPTRATMLPHRQSGVLATLLCAIPGLSVSATAQCSDAVSLLAVPQSGGDGFGQLVAASADHMVVADRGSVGYAPRLFVYDASSLLQLAAVNFAFDGSIYALSASDSHFVALGEDYGTNDPAIILAYDLETFTVLPWLDEGLDLSEGVDGDVYVHEETAAVSVVRAQAHGVLVFDLSSAPVQHDFVHRGGGTHQIALSDDHLYAAFNQTITAYNRHAGYSVVDTFTASGLGGKTVALETVDGLLFIAGQQTPDVWVFDIAASTQVATLQPSFPGHHGNVESIAVLEASGAQGARVAVGYRGETYLYDAASQVELARYVASSALSSPVQPLLPNDHGLSSALNENWLLAGASGEAVLFDLAAPCELTTFCYGDGESGSPCLCGNESAAGAREGCRNSTGVGATLRAVGSTAIADDDLTLVAAQGPPGMPGVFVQGETTQALPFFDGVLCMGNPTRRLEFAHFDGQGHLASAGSIAAQGVVAPGATRHYQLWYRDPGGGGPCGTGANLTNGVRIDWL